MNWQLAVVIVLVAAAGLYLVRQSWRTWSAKKTGCGGGCGCGSKAGKAAERHDGVTLIAAEELTLRRRPRDGL